MRAPPAPLPFRIAEESGPIEHRLGYNRVVTHRIHTLDDRDSAALHASFTALRAGAREAWPGDWWLKQTELTTLGYEAILGEIASRVRLAPAGGDAHILDWGGGPGFLSYLLESLGLKMTYYDIKYDYPSYDYVLERLAAEIHFVGDDPVALPFADDTFDAVISCGVLEHVPDARGSLREINRVLKPGGLFFVYHFPNKWSWTEALAGLLGRSNHDVRWTRSRLLHEVRDAGFDIERFDYRYMVPRNLIEYGRLNRFVSEHAAAIYRADRAASRIPGLRAIANALNCVAVKR